MAFDIRNIEYFLAVIEQGSISSAAEALGVSQPTLSRQIHALEQQFNTPLFIRHGRGVLPTEAGKRLQEGLRGLEHICERYGTTSLRRRAIRAARSHSEFRRRRVCCWRGRSSARSARPIHGSHPHL
jgi:DNA-binding transcriptional LysR family regulator